MAIPKLLDVVIPVDTNDIESSIVTMKSLVDNGLGLKLIIHLLTSNQNEAQSAIVNYGCSDIVSEIVQVEDERLESFKTRKGLDCNSYSILLPNMFSECEIVLFVSNKMLFLDNWTGFIDDLGESYARVVPKKTKSAITRRLNIKYEEYFSTDLILFNITKMKSIDLQESLSKIMEQDSEMDYEQAYNVLMNTMVSRFDVNYNYPYIDNSHQLKNSINGTVIGLNRNEQRLPGRYYPIISDLIDYYSGNRADYHSYDYPDETIPVRSIGNADITIIVDVSKSKDRFNLIRTLDSIKYQTKKPSQIICFFEYTNDSFENIVSQYDGFEITHDSNFDIKSGHFIYLYGGDRLYQGLSYIVCDYLSDNHHIFTDFIHPSFSYESDYFTEKPSKNSNWNSILFNLKGLLPIIFHTGDIRDLKGLKNDIYYTKLDDGDCTFLDLKAFNYNTDDSPTGVRYSINDQRKESDEVLVSIIIPVYNGAIYLKESLGSLLDQSIVDKCELICIDDYSDDNTLESLIDFSVKKGILIINSCANYGPGVARNVGYSYAKGKYIMFLDADDIFDEKLLEKMTDAAIEYDADTVICKSSELDDKTKKVKYNESMYKTWMIDGLGNPFSPKDNKKYLFNFVNSWAWDKLFSRKLIDQHSLHFENARRNQDMAFSCMGLVYSNKIFFIDESLILHRKNIVTSQERKGVLYPYTVFEVITAWKQYLIESETYSMYYQSYLNRALAAIAYSVKMCKSNPELYAELIVSLRTHYLDDLEINTDDESLFYDYSKSNLKYIRALRDSPLTDLISIPNVSKINTSVNIPYIKLHDLHKLVDKEVIVSLTTYPARINTIHIVLKCLLKQTYKPDKIVLWLAEEQFPGKKIPRSLLRFSNKVQICWCDDLKPHKKYYYTFKNDPDSIVITVDDDIKYNKRTVEYLLRSYVTFPNCVSTLRANRITFDESGKIAKYKKWEREIKDNVGVPSMDLLATGVGGVLYPPHIFDDKLFDKEKIKDTALYADDLWLKVNELINNVPVVLAHSNIDLITVDGTQESALYLSNLQLGNNDTQLSKIISAYNSHNINKLVKESSLPLLRPPLYSDGQWKCKVCPAHPLLEKICQFLFRNK